MYKLIEKMMYELNQSPDSYQPVNLIGFIIENIKRNQIRNQLLHGDKHQNHHTQHYQSQQYKRKKVH